MAKRSKGGRVTPKSPPVQRAAAVVVVEPDEPMTPARVLRNLERHRKKRQLLDDQADELVATARDLGLSWERIGAARGMTGNGARKRFAGP